MDNYRIYCPFKVNRLLLEGQVKKNKEILFFFLAIIGFIGGTSNFLPAFGFDIYPYGNFLVPFNSLIWTYAIFKHKLFDITIVTRSIVYSILILLVTISYLVIVVITEKYLQGVLGYTSILFSVTFAFILGIALFPIRNYIQNLIDHTFLKGTYAEITEQNRLLLQEVARSEKLKSIAIFASGMAHEVKNPLTAIRTFTEFLPRRLEDKEFLLNFSVLVGKEVGRIDQLVHQILEFAKPSPIQVKAIAIHESIENTLNFLSSEFIKNKIGIHRIFKHDENIILFLDDNQIRQALLNIILNAIAAMKNGGILKISTEIVNTNINIFKIYIADTGSGIDPKDVPHVFDPFFSKKDGGTGLGLSITHGIIKEHGGKIKVESTVGKGTTFIIELPIGPQSTVSGP